MREPQRGEPPAAAAAAGLAAAGNGWRRSAELGAVWPQLPAAAGVRDMKPAAGPIPPMGFAKSAAGALQWRWSCSRFGQQALSSSRQFELLRTPCGGQCELRQVLHDSVADDARVKRARCGTSRQRHVLLATQRCPVRTFWQGGEEAAAGTATYAAWAKAINAMHCRGVQLAPGPSAVAAASSPELPEPVSVPRCLALGPFRPHVVVRAAEVEFCMSCFGRASRFRTVAFRAGCCDEATPTGACPKHILAAVAVGSSAGRPGKPSVEPN